MEEAVRSEHAPAKAMAAIAANADSLFPAMARQPVISSLVGVFDADVLAALKPRDALF